MDGVAVQHVAAVGGRGLVALRDFAEGETLLRERPLVACQYAYNKVRTHDVSVCLCACPSVKGERCVWGD
jgi:hypothetical protein